MMLGVDRTKEAEERETDILHRITGLEGASVDPCDRSGLVCLSSPNSNPARLGSRNPVFSNDPRPDIMERLVGAGEINRIDNVVVAEDATRAG
jgi:hypothetical protein